MGGNERSLIKRPGLETTETHLLGNATGGRGVNGAMQSKQYGGGRGATGEGLALFQRKKMGEAVHRTVCRKKIGSN